MDTMLIRGKKPLRGTVQVGGAKNAALPLLFATLLAPGRHRLQNMPQLRDITTALELLRLLGADVVWENDSTVCLNSQRLDAQQAPYELVRTMRASVLVLGPLLARLGHARVSLPGGCAIGARPIDLHLKGLKALGAQVELDHGYVEARASRLQAARICFDFPTVGGTENLMMAAVLAQGETVLENAAREPEIVDLAQGLRTMGAHIEGDGSDTIHIQGVSELKPLEYQVMPDRIEAGTFLLASVITGGDVLVTPAPQPALDALISKLREAGLPVLPEGEGLRVTGDAPLRSVDIQTGPFPGFPTDMQAQFMSLMTQVEGSSLIVENVFENRFMHVCELQRLGADIALQGNTATVRGPSPLTGAPVMATDLRASASLVLAGLAADNTTEIRRIYHLDRGYAQLERKLALLGADIERIQQARQ